MSGLSLSEIGISNAKKTASAVKKVANPFIQGAKQQITGQTPNPQGVGNKQSAQVPNEPQTSNSFDIVSFAKNVQQQVTGVTKTQSGQVQQTVKTPQASQPPSEMLAKQGAFDVSGDFDVMGEGIAHMPQVQQQTQQDIEAQFAKQKAEDQQKIEQLKKQLHSMYYEEFIKKAEGKDEKKEETVQEKLEREEQEKQQKEAKKQEEDQKMQPIVPSELQGRQGSHEGMKRVG
jgi:hypothetical protein